MDDKEIRQEPEMTQEVSLEETVRLDVKQVVRAVRESAPEEVPEQTEEDDTQEFSLEDIMKEFSDHPEEPEEDPEEAPEQPEERAEEALMIQRHHLDCNNHVNNGQYIKIAGAYLPEGFEIKQMRAEYRRQAYLGNEIVPYIYEKKDKITVSLCDGEKQPYVVVEFQSRS